VTRLRRTAPLLAPATLCCFSGWWCRCHDPVVLGGELQLLSPEKRASPAGQLPRASDQPRAVGGHGQYADAGGRVLLITLVAGTLLAALLDRDFPAHHLPPAVIAPFFVMPTVSALIWKNMFMNRSSVCLRGLRACLHRKHRFFSSMPLLAIILIVAWEWTPFAVLILLPAAVAESRAAGSGAAGRRGPVALFYHIELPHLRRPCRSGMIEVIFFLSLFAKST